MAIIPTVDQYLIGIIVAAIVVFGIILWANRKATTTPPATGQSSYDAPVAVTLTLVQDVRTEVALLEARFKDLGTELENKLTDLKTKYQVQITAVETDIKSVETKIETGFEALVTKVEDEFSGLAASDAAIKTFLEKEKTSVSTVASSIFTKIKTFLVWLKS